METFEGGTMRVLALPSPHIPQWLYEVPTFVVIDTPSAKLKLLFAKQAPKASRKTQPILFMLATLTMYFSFCSTLTPNLASSICLPDNMERCKKFRLSGQFSY